MTDAPPLDRLRALIAGDEALQWRLAEFNHVDDFAVAAAEAAALAGIEVDPKAIVAQSYGDPVGMEQFNPTLPNATGWPSRGWLPTAVTGTPAGLAVSWQHFGENRLTESFYQDSQMYSRSRTINRFMKLRTPLATLLEPAPADATQDAPAGLIFHMSRCGSTLASRMLMQLPGTVVLSEPAPFDSLVQLVHTHPHVPLEERVALLRGMAAALGRDRLGDRERYVIKTNSWHSLALPLFRAAFPDTPWVFLFREPAEVMVSQMRARGVQAMPGGMPEGLYGLSNADAAAFSIEEYIAHVLATVNKAAIEHAALGGGIFIDYADLTSAVKDRILPHFNIVPDNDDLAALQGQIALDSKAPATNFASDRDRKREETTDAIRSAVAKELDDMHRQLTSLAAR